MDENHISCYCWMCGRPIIASTGSMLARDAELVGTGRRIRILCPHCGEKVSQVLNLDSDLERRRKEFASLHNPSS